MYNSINSYKPVRQFTMYNNYEPSSVGDMLGKEEMLAHCTVCSKENDVGFIPD
jgi:hypothetical protein